MPHFEVLPKDLLYFSLFPAIIQDMQVSVEIPDMIAVSAAEARFFLAAKLFEVEKLSLGQAAELCGLSKRAFMEMLNWWDMPVFTPTAAELQSDIANAKRFALPHNS
jgi:predicted HTH domain antitoxin